jgi:hypothetical protein
VLRLPAIAVNATAEYELAKESRRGKMFAKYQDSDLGFYRCNKKNC